MDKERKREGVRRAVDLQRLRVVLTRGALYGLGGYLAGLAELPFGACPFGVALLAASDRNAPFVYAGLVLSCFFGYDQDRGVVLLGIYTALLLLRVLVRLTLDIPGGKRGKMSPTELFGSLFCEAPTYRLLLSALAALGAGLCFLIGGGMLYYDLVGLLISVAVAPAAAYVFYGYFGRRGLLRELGLLAIAAVCVWGAAELSVLGVSVAALVGLLFTLTVAQWGGLWRGVLTGAVLGLVYAPALIPAFVLCALCACIFGRLSPALAAFAAFCAAIGWGFFAKGIYALDGFFAAALSACVLYSAVCRFRQNERAAAKDGAAKRRCRLLRGSELDGVRLWDMNLRMSAVSEGLASLSGFLERREQSAPTAEELEQVCRAALDGSCGSCGMRGECSGGSGEFVSREVTRLATILGRGERVTVGDLSADITGHCARLPDILDEINYNSGLGRAEGRGSGIYNYRTVSRLLERSIYEGGEYGLDTATAAALRDRLESAGLSGLGIAVYGGRRRSVYITAREPRTVSEERWRVLDLVAEAVPFAVDRERASLRRCTEGAALTVTQSDRLGIECAVRQRRAREESSFCGDSLTTQRSREGYYYALISDGMGSGREAAAVSEICTGFLGNMLQAGRMSRELLDVLNGALREGGRRECSATVDLMELDLISGEAVFYKSGAAPTYVYREKDGSLFKLRSRTLPIGILRETDLRRLEITLEAGDVVVMVSDGVTGTGEECPWLFDLLRQNISRGDTERTAELIVKYAIGHGSEDDVSVIVMRVKEI